MTHPSLFETIESALILHEGKHDLAGLPYISHPLSVMRRVSERARHVAVLHDTMEDCGVTREDLLADGYSSKEVEAVELLTRGEDETYEDFIERLATSGNELAIEVKIADLEDNLDPSRPVVNDRSGRRVKYERALVRLREVA